MMRLTTFLAVIMVGFLSVGVFWVKYEVQDLKDEISQLDRTIMEDRQAIHVLKAEWSHLNDPDRLRFLSGRYLGMTAVETEQIGSLEKVPLRQAEPGEVPR
jgi:hypothetical protein